MGDVSKGVTSLGCLIMLVPVLILLIVLFVLFLGAIF
jgi:hypothetical protein